MSTTTCNPIVLVLGISLCLLFQGFGYAADAPPDDSVWKRGGAAILADYHEFYDITTIGQLAAGVGVGGIFANTHLDRDIQHWYQQSVRSTRTDDVAKVTKFFGEGKMTIPASIGLALLGHVTDQTHIGSLTETWATRTLRAMLVGTPPLLLLQRGLGAARPSENNSHWHPFENDNGVSGHSFMGAVPFLSAAMMTERRPLKIALYAGSTFCGLSRINDDKHYFSQAALGWWLAYLAAKSVDRSETSHQTIRMTPVAVHQGLGVGVQVVF